MSKNFYFYKWKEVLKHLKELVDIDVQYQVTKAHDATLPKAVHRLSSILGQYMIIYNEVIECSQQNLQVQKTAYIDHIVKTVVSRILELKQELEKLEGSRFQFFGHGLIEVHQTICDVEMTAIPAEPGRPEHVQADLDKILEKVKKKKEATVTIVEEPEEASVTSKNLIYTEESIEESNEEIVKVVEIPEAIKKTREYLAMILAHEKSRQVIKLVKHDKLKRETWEKELTGRLKPPAKLEIRTKSSILIQEVFRAYFELKRERKKICKRDELLGLNICDTRNLDIQRTQATEKLRNRSKLHLTYEKEWLESRKKLKEEFLQNKRDKICEESRDQIREWFIEWFESIQFIHDIPKAGSAAIFRGDIPDPYYWREENNALAIQNAANKKKSPQDLKFEKKAAKREKMLLKREEEMKIKRDALLLKKMMKNPKMHPGYDYPHSKWTDQLLQVINHYHRSWNMYDAIETLDVKEKYVLDVDVEDQFMEIQLEVLPEVDEEMRQELRQLKQALKEDYERLELEMPLDFTKPIKREKKQKIVKTELSDKVVEMIEILASQGFIVEYPKTKIGDFIGDANFGGEDLRAQILPAFPFNFEIRAYWWERCREVSHGFRNILLVGPRLSGKTVLVHALASVNDAILFELDPYKVQEDQHKTAPFLKHLVQMVVRCARALQPAVIHIKHVQKLFYTKTPPEEVEMNLKLIRTFFIQKLIKQIQKTDKITVIGTCTDPWLAKSSELLKQFPIVLLLPNNTYSLVTQVLKDWVVRHPVVPADFNISNLAQVLQGYSFGYLKEVLEKFMSADRVLKIAAKGLTPMEVYNYILDDGKETNDEYDQYLKWYFEKTSSGAKEMQHLQEQKDFKAAIEKYEAKKKKKNAKSAPSSTTGSYIDL